MQLIASSPTAQQSRATSSSYKLNDSQSSPSLVRRELSTGTVFGVYSPPRQTQSVDLRLADKYREEEEDDCISERKREEGQQSAASNRGDCSYNYNYKVSVPKVIRPKDISGFCRTMIEGDHRGGGELADNANKAVYGYNGRGSLHDSCKPVPTQLASPRYVQTKVDTTQISAALVKNSGHQTEEISLRSVYNCTLTNKANQSQSSLPSTSPPNLQSPTIVREVMKKIVTPTCSADSNGRSTVFDFTSCSYIPPPPLDMSRYSLSFIPPPPPQADLCSTTSFMDSEEVDSASDKPSKPPRSKEGTLVLSAGANASGPPSLQQTDNLVEEIYLSPISGQKKKDVISAGPVKCNEPPIKQVVPFNALDYDAAVTTLRDSVR